MNSVLEVLYLRRPKIDYISPPICLDFVPASSSGSFVVVEAASAPAAPEIFFLDSACHRFFTWDLPAKYFCASVYLSDTEEDPLVLAADCVQNYWYSLCSPGWWKVVALIAGLESTSSEPMVCDGTSPIRVPIPRPTGVTGWRVYKNPIFTDANAQFFPVLDTTRTALVEVCEGCYRIRVITKEGHTELSNILCMDDARLDPACCTQVTCPSPLAWDSSLCSCVTDVSDIVGPTEQFCIGEPYASQFTAVGGTAPYSWTLLSGAFPPGLSFVSGITLGISNPVTGTPTAGGSYSVTIRCQSKNGIFVDRTFSFFGYGVAEYTGLPSGITDTAYSYNLTASYGTPPFTFSLETGSLPTGLVLSSGGNIGGVPFYTGTYSFSVRITDSLGVSCVTPLSISIPPCPTPSSFPVIASWDATYPDMQYSAIDPVRRRMWLTHPYAHAVPLGPPYPQPYQIVSVVSTATKAFLQYATDTSGYVNSTGAGDLGNGISEIFYDSKYDQMVVCGNQFRAVLYNAETMDCQGIYQIPNLGAGYASQLYHPQNPYDRNRGYVYLVTRGGAMSVRVLDLNPLSPGIVGAAYPGDGRQCIDAAYDPVRDRLYLGDYLGTGSYHIWDPVAHTFAYQQGPVTVGTCVGLRYLPVLDRILVAYSNGNWSVVNPDTHTADATFVSGGGAPLIWAVYNSCNGFIYAGSGADGGGIESIDTLNSYATAAVDFGNQYYSWLVDEQANLLFAPSFTTKAVNTF